MRMKLARLTPSLLLLAFGLLGLPGLNAAVPSPASPALRIPQKAHREGRPKQLQRGQGRGMGGQVSGRGSVKGRPKKSRNKKGGRSKARGSQKSGRAPGKKAADKTAPGQPQAQPGGQSDGGGGRAYATSSGEFNIHLDQFNDPVGARMIGIAHLGGSKAGLLTYKKTLPEGGLYRIFVRVDNEDSAMLLAGQMRLARKAGMHTLLTLVGTPWELASDRGTFQPEGGLPAYARSVPVSSSKWAEVAAAIVRAASSEVGAPPDYLEIWNEPGRREFWSGSPDQFLDLFKVAARSLKGEFGPFGVLVGGPGQAGPGLGRDGGKESLLMALPRLAAEEGMPLDFLSWHHYIMANGLRYHQTIQKLHDKLDQLGLPGVKLLVSEWNVTPSTSGYLGTLADGPAAAAQYAGFVSSAADLGLDGQAFFMLQDVGNQQGIADLKGRGLGALTKRGIKKPVYRVMEFMNPMSREAPVAIDYPQNEWAVSVWGTRSGNRVRLVIGNDTVDPDWVWLHGTREQGADPAVLSAAVRAAGYRVGEALPSAEKLMNAGLSEAETVIALDVLERTLQAKEVRRHPRSLTFHLDGSSQPAVTSVWRFDQEHNNPAAHLDAILPTLTQIEDAAHSQAGQALADFLSEQGAEIPPETGTITAERFHKWAVEQGLEPKLATRAWAVFRSTLQEMQTSQIELLNSLPETALQLESAGQAGIVLDQQTMTVSIQPDSVIVLDLAL